MFMEAMEEEEKFLRLIYPDELPKELETVRMNRLRTTLFDNYFVDATFFYVWRSTSNCS